MKSLRELLEEALASTTTDVELATTLVDSGAIDVIVQRGTYDDQAVLERLSYASAAGMRAAVSKARRSKGSFPIPKLEGRRWSRTEVDTYRNSQRESSQ